MSVISYRIILVSMFSMLIASGLLYFELAETLAYVLLAGGFFGTGIGILIGFFHMVRSDSN